MATAVKVRPKTAPKQEWSDIVQQSSKSEAFSIVFVKNLLAIAISNVTYLRAIFPEHAFGERVLDDVSLKVLKANTACIGADRVIGWIKGCFDALEKRYLRQIVLAVYRDPNNPESVLESYVFKFSYSDGDRLDIYRDNKSIGAYQGAEINTKNETTRMIRTLVLLTQNLGTLPDNVMMTMKLLYYDEATPEGYQPPGFVEGEDDELVFEDEAVSIRVGDISTKYHELKIRVRTVTKHFSTTDEQEQEAEPATEQLIAGGDNTAMAWSDDGDGIDVAATAGGDQGAQRGDDDDEVTLTLQSSSCDAKSREVADLQSGLDFHESDQEDIVMRQTGDDSDVSADKGVRCACGCNEDDGLMVLCSSCKYWQHGYCYGIAESEDAPEKHVCERCADPFNPTLLPTDPSLCHLHGNDLQLRCLWRRALMACVEMKRVLPVTLSHRLGVEMNVAQGIINRLEADGYVRLAPKNKRKLGKIADKGKITKEAFPKFFSRNTTTAAAGCSDEISVGDEVVEDAGNVNTPEAESQDVALRDANADENKLKQVSLAKDQHSNKPTTRKKRSGKRVRSANSPKHEFELNVSHEELAAPTEKKCKTSKVSHPVHA